VAGTGATWSHLAADRPARLHRRHRRPLHRRQRRQRHARLGSAWLVTHLDFPLRRSFEWALVLPLAMPAYVMAYTYADVLQFAGPLQSWLREAMGWKRGDYWFPDVRSVGGAIVMLSCVSLSVRLICSSASPSSSAAPPCSTPAARSA
jgi:iron(III) transport system permease protein